jgi:hypothetical protein
MKIGTLLIGAALALMATAGTASAAVVVISDPSFESPSLPSGAYEYGVQNGAQHSSNGVDVTASGLTFGNGAGIQSNGSAWNFAPAPDGTQTAFLQSYNDQTPGVITQDVSGLTPGKSYDISFFDADRAGYGVDPVTVYFDGAALGTYTPASTNWNSVTTASFIPTSSNGVITYSVGLNAGDADIGLDDVSISAVPEPAVWAMMLMGVFGLGATLRNNRRSLVGSLARA